MDFQGPHAAISTTCWALFSIAATNWSGKRTALRIKSIVGTHEKAESTNSQLTLWYR